MPRFENPPYYITAYGLAVKRGFKGTLDEWIASLKGEKGDQGDKVELRYLEDKIQWRWIPDAGAAEDTAAEEDAGTEGTTETEDTEDLKDDYEWHDLIDVAEIRGDIIEKTLDTAQQAAADAEQMAVRADEAADAATAAQTAAEAAAGAAKTSETNAGNAETNARQSAQEAQTSADAAAASAAAAAETAKSVDADEIQKEIEKRGNNIWKDPATGLLYLMSDEQKLGAGVEVGSGTGGGLAFNGGYTDAEGYLHLTLDGEDLDESVFVPFYVGTGGGGGGYGSTIKLTCGLDSRIFSIMAGETSCWIPYTWTSTDTEDGTSTGNGSATWTVNGSRAAVQKVTQGENSFDIRKYLTDGEENAVILTISDAYGNSKNMTFTITVTAFGLTWYLEDMAYHKSETLTIRMDPTGAGDKLVKLSVDGTNVFEQNVSTTGRTISTTVGPLSHGAHVIEAWMEVEVEGETLPTEKLRHVGIWTVDGTTTKIVGVLTPELTVSQYGTAAVKYMVVDPASETANVELQVDGTTVSVLSDVDRAVQTWAYKARTVGTETLGIVCGSASDTVELTVTSLGYDIAPVTAGLVLDIDPAGHSNTEAGRANFGYTDADGVNHPFTFSDNFDWTGGGFQLDADGVTAFVVKRGCYVTADCSLFADNAKTNGKEIKLIFKSENVRNSDAELLSCMSGNVGLKLQAQQATVGSEAESMSVLYYEGKKIEMDVNIQSDSESSLAWISLKGVPSAEPVQYGSTDSWTQTAPQNLTIGSEDADVWIYRVKMYGNSLNRFEILDNFVADCTDPEEMVDRHLRNDIFNDDGTISISKLTARNTKLRAIHIRAKRMTTGKDDEVVADVEIIYEAGGEEHHLIAQNVVFKAQGTSSLEYILAALNLDIDFSKATSWVNGKGETITSYAFTENSIPVDYFNIKADVASSESANNVVLTDDYNAYNPVPFAGKTGNVRDCIEGHPAAVFFTNTSDASVSIGARTVAAGETVLYFAGNMNNSKKNFAVFGWDNTKWPEQCCVEVLNNIDLQCRFRSDDLSTETWDGAEGTSSFEFAFPKKPTDAMKENFSKMLSWVVSTATDLATGNALAAPVILNGTTYANDTAAYRAAKFLAEFDNYFVRDQMLFHFLFTERHCMADNRSKNVFFCYDYYEDVGGYRWSVRRNYDNDTAEGCDNSGGATFSYGLELNDKVGDSYANQDSYQQLLDSIVNQQPFSYDLQSDPSWGSYKKAYMREGDRASANALAQASAASGGRASSYAMTAAQQAGNYYAGQLADIIPTLEQNAYSRYLSDFNNRLSSLGAMETDRAFDYQNYLNQFSQLQTGLGALQSDRDFDYENWMNEYNMLQNSLGNYQGQDATDYQRYLDAYNQAYQAEQDRLAQEQLAYENALASYQTLGYATPEVAKILGISAGSGGSSGGGGSGGSGGSGGGGGTTGAGGLGDTTLADLEAALAGNDEETVDTSNFTVTNRNGNGWVAVGAGRMTWTELERMVNQGKIVEVIDPDKGTITYKYASSNNNTDDNSSNSNKGGGGTSRAPSLGGRVDNKFSVVAFN